MLTLERAKELLKTTTTEEHLFLHAMNVSVAMGGMAEHFGEDKAHWMAIGHLHDYDYQQHPDDQPRRHQVKSQLYKIFKHMKYLKGSFLWLAVTTEY